jgi:hypothetical protein
MCVRAKLELEREVFRIRGSISENQLKKWALLKIIFILIFKNLPYIFCLLVVALLCTLGKHLSPSRPPFSPTYALYVKDSQFCLTPVRPLPHCP